MADDGPGIPLADQPFVFERFYRSESEAAQRSQGSGLGLPIAPRSWSFTAVASGWRAPGAGATFYVTLPLSLSGAEPGSQPQESASDTSGNRDCVLRD